jgi:hypothetical protein
VVRHLEAPQGDDEAGHDLGDSEAELVLPVFHPVAPLDEVALRVADEGGGEG